MTASARPRLVIDTNILAPGMVGALASPPKQTASAGLLRAWQAGLCSVVVSDDLLDEYRDVLQRPAFGLSPRQARRACDALARLATVVTPLRGRPLLTRDPGDDMVLKTALADKVDFIVTDNIRHFKEIANLPGGTADLRYRGVQVVGLSQALDVIRATHPNAGIVLRRR